MGRHHDGCSKTTNWWEQSSRRHSFPTSMLEINKQWNFLCLHLRKYDCCWKSMHWCLYVTELSVMGHVAAWPLFGPLSRRPVTGSCFLQLDWWSGARWCCQRVPGHRSGCRDWEIGTRDGGPGGGWDHAPLDWNSYCVHELAHNTLLFLFVFVFD